jgi:hypothetical protein
MRWPAPLEVLLALNVGVFLLWAFGSARRMTRHFEVSPGSLPRRPWTLLTATVSHSDLYSLVGNLQVRSPALLCLLSPSRTGFPKLMHCSSWKWCRPQPLVEVLGRRHPGANICMSLYGVCRQPLMDADYPRLPCVHINKWGSCEVALSHLALEVCFSLSLSI